MTTATERADLAAWANDPAIPGAPILTADSPAADVLAEGTRHFPRD